MSNPMPEPARRIAAAVVFVALALGIGESARADAPMTEEQAEAAIVSARAVDAARGEESANDDVVLDARIVETVIWSEPDDPPAWFPPLEETTVDLTLAPSPMQTAGLSAQTMAAQEAAVIANEHTVIPLPPAAWTGLAGLASLATIGGRKALGRFFFS